MTALSFQVARVCISLRNIFSEKKYQVELIGKVIFITRVNPEIVIHDYYFYVVGLLRKNVKSVSKNCFLLFECRVFNFLELLLPLMSVRLQIEHTLVRPEGGDSENYPVGCLDIPDGSGRYLVRIDNFEEVSKANIIFDYSRINLHNIRSTSLLKAYSEKAFCVSPNFYPLHTSAHGREGIITLFGNPDDSRRKLFLEMLKMRHIDSRNIRGIYFGIDEYYRRAKIVINIRQTDYHDTLEELRVLPALRSGAIVISEAAPYAVKTWYSKFIIWGSLAQLPELIANTEKNYNHIHAQIFGNSTQDSPFFRRMKRIEQCNELTMLRVSARLNQDLAKH